MNAKQLGYTVEEYKGVFRFFHKEKGITIYVNLFSKIKTNEQQSAIED